MGRWTDEAGWVEDDEVSSLPGPKDELGSELARIGRLGGQHGKGRKKKIDPSVARARARKAAQARWKKP